MAMQTIRKEILITAPKEVVWQVLLNDEFTHQWYRAFGEGLEAETDWQVGSKAVFSDQTRSGLIARITENREYEVIVLEYEGAIINGQEDYETSMSQAIKGGKEIYLLVEINGATHLSVSSDMDISCFDQMSGAWEKALEHLKALAEKATKEVETVS